MKSNSVRYTFHGVLAFALVIGVGMVWVMLKALDGKADDLVRYARVDNWTTQQTESQSYQFLLTLSEHVAGKDGADIAEVRHQLASLASTADLLDLDERSPVVQALPGKQDLRADFKSHASIASVPFWTIKTTLSAGTLFRPFRKSRRFSILG